MPTAIYATQKQYDKPSKEGSNEKCSADLDKALQDALVEMKMNNVSISSEPKKTLLENEGNKRKVDSNGDQSAAITVSKKRKGEAAAASTVSKKHKGEATAASAERPKSTKNGPLREASASSSKLTADSEGTELRSNRSVSLDQESEKDASPSMDSRASRAVQASAVPPLPSRPTYSVVAGLVLCLLRAHDAAMAEALQDPELISSRDSSTEALFALKRLHAHVDSSRRAFDVGTKELAYCGAYAAVLQAMTSLHHDEVVQLESIMLLWTCAGNDEGCRLAIRQLGGVQVVARALKAYPDMVALQMGGYGLLSELLRLSGPVGRPISAQEKQYHPCKKMVDDSNEFKRLIPMAVPTLRAHMKNPGCVRWITAFLLRLVHTEKGQDESIKAALLEVDCLQVAFDVVRLGGTESQEKARDLMKALL